MAVEVGVKEHLRLTRPANIGSFSGLNDTHGLQDEITIFWVQALDRSGWVGGTVVSYVQERRKLPKLELVQICTVLYTKQFCTCRP